MSRQKASEPLLKRAEVGLATLFMMPRMRAKAAQEREAVEDFVRQAVAYFGGGGDGGGGIMNLMLAIHCRLKKFIGTAID